MKIAIIGKMCSGKSTIANQLCRFDSSYSTYSLATKLKEIAYELFHMKDKDRDLLIKIGTKMREIDPDVWVNYIINQTSDNKNYIIDDVRFQNEVDILKQYGWKFIQLNVSYSDQEYRIKQLYSNYEIHLKNRKDISETNILQVNPILTLDTSKLSIKQINHELYLLLVKSASKRL